MALPLLYEKYIISVNLALNESVSYLAQTIFLL